MQGSEFFKIIQARIDAGDPETDPGCIERMLKNPVCRKCHDDFAKKYPDQPFKIRCEGIWEDDEIREIAEEAEMSFEEAKEIKNPVFWASRHIKLTDDEGQKVFFAARWYQDEILRCTAYRKVDRTGRGMGKTTMGIIEELHKVTTKRNFEILVVTPAKAQAQKWFSDIKDHINADDDLRDALAGTPKQAPYFELKFKNGSNIRIFCTGASSGKHGDNLRTQTPRRTRMDEQDYLGEEDYKAIQPFFRRYRNSEVHGSSTPTGARGMYYKMCKKLQDYKEFHFPITGHPDWSPEMEEACRAEARTELVFMHEYMAEFGELAAGVFKPEYIDASLKDYRYADCTRSKNDKWKYFIGVDWNGQGTGTKIRVVGYNPETHIRRIADSITIDKTVMASLDGIRQANRKWKPEEIYIDAGFGYVQDELLKLIGQNAEDDDDKRLLDIKKIDFGANIQTNKLVPMRDKVMYVKDEENELERRTKPFLVEGLQMVVEGGLFEFSKYDTLLEEQMRAYRVKNYSQHGWANTYEAGKNNEIGDHDLDATMLACLGIELNYGLFYEHRRKIEFASGFVHIPGVGSPSAESAPEMPAPEVAKLARMNAANIPSRQVSTKDQSQLESRVAWFNGRQAFVAPPQPGSGAFARGNWGNAGLGSRTAIFRNPRRSF